MFKFYFSPIRIEWQSAKFSASSGGCELRRTWEVQMNVLIYFYPYNTKMKEG